jgi:3-oxoacyl-[acyl-carrier protein] reductase
VSERGSERVGLVIGGASGIGWAVAKGLAAEGCRVTVADLNGGAHLKRYPDVLAHFERMSSATDERLRENEKAT